jgi:hypothetical protein
MKVYAINVTRNKGISVKKNPNGSAYDLASLQVLTRFEPQSWKRDDGSEGTRNGYGLIVTELPCRTDCIEEFKDITFPQLIEVQTEQEVVFGRLTTIVTGLAKQPVRAAA